MCNFGNNVVHHMKSPSGNVFHMGAKFKILLNLRKYLLKGDLEVSLSSYLICVLLVFTSF